MAKTWRAGVIGCGSIAQAMHVPGYVRCPGVVMAAACDPVPARRREVAKIADGVKTYNDYKSMLKAEPLDVVSICTPNTFHAEHACAALRAGAHVLLEKPAALSMKQIEQIRRAVKESGRKLIVGFSHRFKRGNITIQKLLKDKMIGTPFMIRVRLAHTGPYPGWAKSDWFYQPPLAGGGAMLDMGIHAIDLSLWHLGPVKSVQARACTLRKKIKVDDNAVLLLEFAKTPALGYLEVGWTSPAGFTGVEILGDEGCIVLDYGTNTLTMTTGRITPDMKSKSGLKTKVIDRNPEHGGWSAEVGLVINAFRKNTDLGMGIDAGGAALAVALAAYESSKSGKRTSPSAMK